MEIKRLNKNLVPKGNSEGIHLFQNAKDNLIYFKDTNGVLQQVIDYNTLSKVVSDIVGGSNELSEILVNGNVTGGSDIIISSGDNIRIDAFNYRQGIFWDQGQGNVNTKITYYDDEEMILTCDGGFIFEDEDGTITYDSNILEMESGGAQHPKIKFNRPTDGFNLHGTLTKAVMTGQNVWTLPDASGTIALTSQIVAPTLEAVLVAGSTSNGNNIGLDNNSFLQIETGGYILQKGLSGYGVKLYGGTYTAARTLFYPDVDGDILATASSSKNYLTKFNTTSGNVGNSMIQDDGNSLAVGISAASAAATFHIVGNSNDPAIYAYHNQASGPVLSLLSEGATNPNAIQAIVGGDGKNTGVAGYFQSTGTGGENIGGTFKASGATLNHAILISAGDLKFADGCNIKFNTSTGTKIGTATTQKMGFFDATPVVQQAALTAVVGTATDGTIGTNDTITNNIRTRLGDLESRLATLGLVAPVG